MNPDISDGDLLWTPSPGPGGPGERDRVHRLARPASAACTSTATPTLWRWSVTDLDGFWQAVWDYFGIAGVGAARPRCSAAARMPGARVVPRRAAELRRSTCCGSERPGRRPRCCTASETTPLAGLSWEEFAGQVRDPRHPAARNWACRPGDRVVSLHAEHPADRHRDAGHHQHRRHLGELLPRLRLARRDRQVRAARHRRCCSAWTATATAARSSTAAPRCAQIIGRPGTASSTW